MKLCHRFLSIAILSLLLPISAFMSVAQDSGYDQSADVATNESPAPPASETPDPPARAARLQYMAGSVSVQPQGTGDWITGQLNRPLTNSDNIWADKSSKAEISLGTGLARIDSESSLTLTNIGENSVQLQLHQGAMNLHVRRLYDNEIYEVDTPNQAFTVLKPGDYRFDVDADADKTVITVWSGEGESSAQGQTVRVREGQQARFGEGTISADDIHPAPSPDSFDQWARSRDERLDHTVASRHVSPDVVGYEDLDEYGTWRDSGDYGDVWVPSGVPAGWAPYTYGHWIWEEPWGWTWVDYDPWGYAPFHYGRWVYTGGYWGWAPGPIWARPYYAPALVTWFGGGWGVGFGFGGGFGWCPLGFGEPFIPWFGVSRTFFTNINITNTHITNITNIYNNNFINGRPRPVDPRRPVETHFANMNKPGGFTAVSRNTLVNSLPVARNNIRVSPGQFGRLTPVRGTLDVKPTRTSMLGGNRSVAAPTRSFARPVVSRMAMPVNRPNSGFKPSTIDRPGTQMGNNRGAQRPSTIDRPGTQMGNNRGAQRPSTIDRPGTQMGNVQRPTTNMPARGPAANNGSFGQRSFPHPPSAGVESRNNVRFGSPTSGGRPNAPTQSGRPNAPTMRSESVPHPPTSNMSRGGAQPSMNSSRGGFESGPRGGNAPAPPRSNTRSGPRSEMSVPRPPASSSPRGYSAAADRGGFSNSRPESSPSYQSNNRPNNNNRPSYGGGSYSRPAPSPSYDRGSSGRSMPSYGGGNYSRPAPSYGGGGYSRPAPSYGGGNYGGGRAPSYGGGNYGGGRAPSYGGGGRSYGGGGGSVHSSGGGGGGGRSYSGGGGGGGGGHVSGGGGGGRSSGSSHGGRH